MNSLVRILATLPSHKHITLQTGEILFEQNEQAKAIFSINSGKIKLQRNTIDGNVAILHVALSNESFAEAALFSDHYHCQAVAVTETNIQIYNKQLVLDFLANHPAECLIMIKALAQQTQSMRALLEIRNIRSAKDRLFQHILNLANGKASISIATSYKDLAYQLGLTHETLYRKLKQLESEQLIQRHKNNITILRS